MSRLDTTIAAKKQKRASLEAEGIVVHPYSFVTTHEVQSARDSMGQEVTTAGRIMRKREHGKVTFLTLQDHTGSIQVLCKEENLGTRSYGQLISAIDTADHLGVSGLVMRSKTDEISIEARSITVLSKALRALPSTFHSLEDKEVRFRKRYLDMLIDPAVKKILDARWLIEKELRRFLQDVYHFVEVETPILQPLYGGTNARPFTTHMHALDADFFLRIAPELYLKRLIIGGYDRVFEIARNFRNEGIDQTHQPEFTMIEWYQAYADYTIMMDTAESMIKHLCQKVHGELTLTVGTQELSIDGEWPRLTMQQAIHQYMQLDVSALTDEQLRCEVETRSLEITGSFSRGKCVFALFDKCVADRLLSPTWIIDYPKEVSPLAKQHRSDTSLVERFELYVGGKEIADGWSEITDALDQRRRFEHEQQKMREGDEEAQPLDEDFLEAMEYGMPPLGGIGIGIDRLVMLITNTWSIKEVIAFPTLRPTEEQIKMSLQMQGKKAVTPESRVSSASNQERSWTESSLNQNDRIEIGLSREEAIRILQSLVGNPNLRSHMLAVEAAMGGLWEFFSSTRPGEVTESRTRWELLGLLHDADWEQTESTPELHTVLTSQHLSTIGVDEQFSDSLRTHNYAHVADQRKPTSLMEWSLYACDHMTGIIVATALVSPEKRLAGVTIERVLKKFKEKSFAKGATREEIIEGAQALQVSIEELATICLASLQKHSQSIGL